MSNFIEEKHVTDHLWPMHMSTKYLQKSDQMIFSKISTTEYRDKRKRKRRIPYLVSVVITIILGLASRKYGQYLPIFMAQNAGDVLWAMMVYFGFRFLRIHSSLLSAICLSFLFSFGIEFSQIYQTDWINQVHGTLLGALILGKGFLVVDLVRYAVGIILASILDKLTLS